MSMWPVLDSQRLSQIAASLTIGAPVVVDETNEIHCLHAPQSGLRKFVRANLSSAQASDQKLAQIFVMTVKQKQTASIVENSTDRSLEIAKRFLKTSILPKSDLHLSQLKQELTAARLGISSEVLQENPGFQQFAEISHLHRYLLRFKQTLEVDPQTKKIKILRNGVATPWEAVAALIAYENNLWTGHYSKRGVETKSRYDWETLEPFASGDPAEWGNQYVFEYVIWNQETPSISGEPNPPPDKPSAMGIHTFFRLKTPAKSDNIYSVGLYRPDKHTSWDLTAPLRVRKAKLMQPDESEFWGGRFVTLAVAITPAQFLAIKKKVEADKAADQLIYHITHKNCNEYTGQVARLAGVDIHSLLPIVSLFSATPADSASLLPPFLQKTLNITLTTTINLIGYLFLGASRVDPEVATHPDAQPHMGLRHLFDQTKTQFSHPFMLEQAFKKIEGWRATQVASLQTELAALERAPTLENSDEIEALQLKIRQSRFAIPAEYQV